MLTWLWILFALFLFIDLLISATRASLVHARLTQIISLTGSSPEAVDRTIQLLEKPQLSASLRAALSLAHFFLALLGFWLLAIYTGSPVDIPMWQPFAVIAGLLLAVLLLEYLIEGWVLRQPEVWALRFTTTAVFFDFLFSPLTWLLVRLLGPDSGRRAAASVTEDELKNWVEDERTDSTLEKGERKMIYSIFQFSDTLVREIMVPRIDVFALDVNTSIPDAIQAVLLSGHSRLPVYEDSIDNIIGLLYAKDLLRPQHDAQVEPDLRALLREAYFVPEAKKVDELLAEMQARGVHMSIVVDEYGGMAGLVTLEDIVEEIVGEIRDEYDQSEELLYQQVSPDEYLLLGRIDLDDLNEILGTHLTREVADTLAGYIYGQIGRVPTGSEQIEVESWRLTVEQVNGRRIRLVRAHRITKSGEIEEKEHESEQ